MKMAKVNYRTFVQSLILQMNADLIYSLSGELCAADIEAIANWKLELTVDDGDLLVDSGRDELRQLGQRFKERLPELFDGFSEEDIIFRTTKKQRAMESGKAFSEGAFPGEEVVIPPPLEDDMMLRVRNCFCF